MFYDSLSKGPYKVAGTHDPDSIRTITIVLRPPLRENSKVYYLPRRGEGDIVIPSVFTGVYYEVKNPGITASVEPVMDSEIGSETIDGSVTWIAKAYNMLIPGINVASATCTATNGVTVSSVANTLDNVQFTIGAISELAEARSLLTFDTHLHIVLSDGDAIDVTTRFKISER